MTDDERAVYTNIATLHAYESVILAADTLAFNSEDVVAVFLF